MKFILLPLFTLLACQRTEKNININNSVPEVVITSHQDGDSIYTEVSTEFKATVSDANDLMGDLEVQWTMGSRVACSFGPPDVNGVSVCVSSLIEGESEIQVEVRDPQNATGLAQLSLALEVSNAPSVNILSPIDEGQFYSDEIIEFSGTVTDAEDDPSDLTIYWESSIMGVLSADTTPDSSGNIGDFINLSPGEHGITLHAEDSSGKSTSQSITIVVSTSNTLPVCEIQSPLSGTFGLEGELVIFEGIVNDVDIPNNELSVEWSSNIDGTLGVSIPNTAGEVTFPWSDLSTNTHVINMTVTDDVGDQCVADTIYSVGSPPSIVLNSPPANTTYTQGDNITFSATVTDNEDLPSELTLSWVSSIDGEFSTTGPDSSDTAQFSTNLLSNGSHSITITVTDSDGLYSSILLDIDINGIPTQPTVLLQPDPAYTTDDLVAIASGSTDPDGQSISYIYEWYLNGNNSGVTGNILGSSFSSKNQIWTIRATPTDGISNGPYIESSITISNSAPVISGLSISPSAPTTQDSLSCLFTDTDADGDPISTTIEWLLNTNLLSNSTPILTGPFTQNDVLTCRVTPTDGITGGIAVEASVSIINAPPTISSVTLSPNPVQTDDILTVVASASDSDNDPLSYTFDWYVDTGSGMQLVQTTNAGSFNTDTLDGVSFFDRGDLVYVTVTTDDGNNSTSADSPTQTVENTPPSAFNPMITPSDPVAGIDDLLCSSQTSDADSDSVTLYYEWTVDGVLSSITTDTVPGAQTLNGEIWLCTLTPNDTFDDGAVVSSSVEIGANSEGAEGISFCASAGLTTDNSGNTAMSCLSDEGISGAEAQDNATNTLQPGSHYVFSPE